MACDISQLKKAAVALGGGTYPTAAASFTRGLLVSSFDCSPEQTVERVPEVRGSLETRRVTKGPISYKPKLSFALDAGDATSGSIGDFLASILGAEAGSVSTTFFLHKFTLLDSSLPPYLNLYSDKDAVAKQLIGFRPSSVKIGIKATDPMIKVDIEGIAANESDLAAAQTVVFSGTELLTPQMAAALTLAGSAVDSFESIDITINREYEPIQTIGNTRVISCLPAKQFSIEIAVSGIGFANETERAKFKANTASSMQLKLQDAAGNYLDCVFAEMFYKTFEGPNINDTDILRVNFAGLVTGAKANNYFELKNKYAYRYDTGVAIS